MHNRVWLAQGVQAFPATRLPDEEFPPATAPAATGQPSAIRTPGHARRQAPMLLQFREQRAVGGLPQAHAAIIAATGQARPVRTPHHLTYPGRGVCMTDPPALTCCHLPYLHPLLIAPSGQKRSIWTPGNAIEEGFDAVGVPQGLHNGSRAHVPHAHPIVPPTPDQE